MKYEFHPEALAEYHEASRYFAECQPGLELRFIEAVEHAIQLILESPRQSRRLRMRFDVVLPAFLLMPFFILLNRIMCSSLRSCTVGVSQVIGGIA
jgi:hypothetical protein